MQCTECQLHKRIPSAAPMQPWKWPTPRDFAGPAKGKMYLVIVDAHLKWIKGRDLLWCYTCMHCFFSLIHVYLKFM